MTATLFISDLHLALVRPRLIEEFHALVSGPAQGADALYVLGDLFDDWVGDDQLRDPLAAGVAQSFARLTATGTRLYFQHGNRDFLLGDAFMAAAGGTLLPDAKLVDLYGVRTLIMHGDTLCTDDMSYQKFRVWSRDAKRQQNFLRFPYVIRRGFAAFVRRKSRGDKAAKAESIMDVNEEAVAEALRENGYPRLIHGHTHRPARHEHIVDGHRCARWVLADWYDRGSYLRVTPEGISSQVVTAI